MAKKVTIGYKYYLGLHMVLCHGPIDKITAVEVGGKVAWSGTSSDGSITINASELFGGEKREGGVSGGVDFNFGSPSQPQNAYLQARLGTDIPAYRGVVSAVLKQVYIGLNPYLKRWAFWGSRIHVRQSGLPQWYDSKAEIAGDMNPAHIIRECLTDPDWGMGYPEGDIDDSSFTTAANTLYSEGMGISLLWDRSTPLEDFIKVVIQHIDASLRVSRATGKFELKLVRQDYIVGNLTTLDENSIDRIVDFTRSAVGELINTVTAVYWDALTGANNSVTVQDIALIAQQQGTIGTTRQFPGFTKGSVATNAASRTLRAVSTPLSSATIFANRRAANLSEGDAFVLSWPRYGVVSIVMRVINIEFGALDSNVVKIQAIEDVFATAAAVYAPPPLSEWVDPVTAPTAVLYHSTIEAPYWELVQQVGVDRANSTAATSGFIVATGARPSGGAGNAGLYTKPPGGEWSELGSVDFCPTATITVSMSVVTTVVPIANGVDLDLVEVGSYATLGTELVRVDAVSSSSVTLGRGTLDTVPSSHTSGARLMFSDAFYDSDQVEYASGESVQIRLLPITGLGQLPLTSAPVQTVVVGGRHAKPYPPGRLRLNGVAYGSTLAGTDPLVVSWAHRNRLQQTASILDTTAGSVTSEAGVTYTCQILTAGGAVLISRTGLTSDSTTFSVVDLGANYGTLRVKLWSVRGGVVSHQAHDWPFVRSA